MEINANIIFCNDVIVNSSNNKKTPGILGPLKSITPRNIPGNYTFSIFLSIENVSQEYKELKNEIYNTENIKVFDTGIINLETLNFNKQNKVYFPIVLTTELRNIVIEKPGCFTAKVLLDGQTIAEEKLTVKSQL